MINAFELYSIKRTIIYWVKSFVQNKGSNLKRSIKRGIISSVLSKKNRTILHFWVFEKIKFKWIKTIFFLFYFCFFTFFLFFSKQFLGRQKQKQKKKKQTYITASKMIYYLNTFLFCFFSCVFQFFFFFFWILQTLWIYKTDKQKTKTKRKKNYKWNKKEIKIYERKVLKNTKKN